MEAGPELDALQGLLLLESLVDEAEDRHVSPGPLDQQLALVGQSYILNLVIGQNFTETNTPHRYKDVTLRRVRCSLSLA
jgi:hypothetical protein